MRDNIRGRLNKLEAEVPPDPPAMACFSEGDYASRAEMYQAIEKWKRENPNHVPPLVVLQMAEAEQERRRGANA